MSLLDFDDDPPLFLLRQALQGAADVQGIPLQQLQGVQTILGRISGISSRQIEAWRTQGFEATADLFSSCGDMQGGPDNGDFVQFYDSNTGGWSSLYRITGRARRVAKGAINSYFKYPVTEETFGNYQDSAGDQQPGGEPLFQPPLGFPPPAPVVAISGATPNVTLTWPTKLGVAYYNVWRGTASGAESFLASMNGGVGMYVDSAAPLPGPNYYVVYAQNQYGQTKSNEVSG